MWVKMSVLLLWLMSDVRMLVLLWCLIMSMWCLIVLDFWFLLVILYMVGLMRNLLMRVVILWFSVVEKSSFWLFFVV